MEIGGRGGVWGVGFAGLGVSGRGGEDCASGEDGWKREMGGGAVVGMALGGGRIDWVVDFLDGGISDAVVVMGKKGIAEGKRVW